jgi:hypothetical protein
VSDLIETKPLLQTHIANAVWDECFEADRKEFTRRVREYILNGFPGWKIMKVDQVTRIIYLQDER